MPARLDREVDFADLLRNAGYTPQLEVLEAGWTTLDETQAARLERSAGRPAFRTKKRWRANGVPVMVAVDLIPVAREVDNRPDPTTTIVELARRLGAGRAEWVCTWPGAANMDASTAELFDRHPGEAALTLEHVGVGRRGRRCFWAFEHHRPGFLGYGIILTV
jgi:DNA-binding GntR family transcriptional regulator